MKFSQLSIMRRPRPIHQEWVVSLNRRIDWFILPKYLRHVRKDKSIGYINIYFYQTIFKTDKRRLEGLAILREQITKWAESCCRQYSKWLHPRRPDAHPPTDHRAQHAGHGNVIGIPKQIRWKTFFFPTTTGISSTVFFFSHYARQE